MERITHCLVVDDEPLAAGLLEKHIAQFSHLKLVAKCWNAIEAFEVLQREKIDLLFLDIQMPGLSGVAFLRSLKERPAVIFTTAYRDYAVESYELDVVDYLVKPITLDRFLQAVHRYGERFAGSIEQPVVPLNQQVIPITQAHEADSIFVSTNRKRVRIRFEDVQYIESLKDYVRIHMEGEPVITKERISVFEQELPAYFLRIHRSYIVNTYKVTSYTAHDVEIGSHELPIGVSYKKEVTRFLESK